MLAKIVPITDMECPCLPTAHETNVEVMLDQQDFIDILRNGDIGTAFQPIVSLKDAAFLGLEALARPRREDGSAVVPSVFFESARRYGYIVETDRLCRGRALNAYVELLPTLRTGVTPLLFINMDTTVLDAGVANSGFLLSQAASAGIPPGRIVIEIVESEVKDIAALGSFVARYRDSGFLIALDDVGSGHSNFDRFSMIRPDIIKVDRSIISGIDADFCKQETFRALVQLSRKIGALVLAEGVETLEEAVTALNCDADLLQGYFFARPGSCWRHMQSQLEGKMEAAVDRLCSCKALEIDRIRVQHRICRDVVNRFVMSLSRLDSDRFQSELEQMLKCLPFVEAAYVLDGEGNMVTDTVFGDVPLPSRGRLFHCAHKGDDLSRKEYFYMTMLDGQGHYATDSYTSLATGNLVRTISCRFGCSGAAEYVICVDLPGNCQLSAGEEVCRLLPGQH
ncbi:MAG TPA: EAL domain-containing protein [Deltaproteobacteria bacterium]|nr:EAL domain-containing protein [Deltaproteobacteria bacterium]HQB39317.1 EAL domain-containing protein [Deltaproteobacteria bacterium]